MLPKQLIKDGFGVAAAAFWVQGMDSSLDPAFLQDAEYRSAMNVTNRGGIIKTRPGYASVFLLPEGKLQGYTLFKPTGGAWHQVVAVSGVIYISQYPFTSYSPLGNIQFFAGSPMVVFEKATKSVVQNPDGSLTQVDPYDVLMMQDRYSPAAYWDGNTNRHLDPADSETPLGMWMKWSGDRLWVSRDSKLYASDIADPLKFTETIYLSEGGSLSAPDNITGLAEVTSVDIPQLLVFTNNTTTIVQSNVRDRNLWKTTDNFQHLLFPDIGCVSGRAITSQYGQIWWMTTTGITSLNAALASRVSSERVYRDTEMAVSKGNLSPNIDKIAAISFENYLIFSVPSGDKYNRHSWVMDQGVVDKLNVNMPPAWNSFWTGTRPVQWSTASVNGVQRIFHVSVDYDGQNRLWEAFSPSREDNGQPITSYIETKAHANYHEEAQGLDIKTFKFAELDFSEIRGILDVKVYWAGIRGNFKELSVFRFVAPEGNILRNKKILIDTDLFGNSPQSRTVRTTDIVADRSELSDCGIESPYPDRHDRAFSLLIVWSGRAALRSYRLFAQKFDESGSGAAHAVVEEVEDAGITRQGLFDLIDPCNTSP